MDSRVDRSKMFSSSKHLDKLFLQCYEEARKTLERCDITQDNNTFVEMRQTGSDPPGKVPPWPPHPALNLSPPGPNVHGMHPMVEIFLISDKSGSIWPHLIRFFPFTWLTCWIVSSQLQLNMKITTRGIILMRTTALQGSSGKWWKGQKSTKDQC